MQRHEAALIRYVVQHKLHLEDEQFRARFLELFDLDEDHDQDAIMAIEQFASDISCHVLERLIPADRFGMTNLEVARQYVYNAIKYAESGKKQISISMMSMYIDTVLANLDTIRELLAEPDAVNEEHDWSDFK